MLMWQGVLSGHKWLFLGARMPQKQLSLAEDEGSSSSPLNIKPLQQKMRQQVKMKEKDQRSALEDELTAKSTHTLTKKTH